MKKFLLLIWRYLPGRLQRLATTMIMPRFHVIAAAIVLNEQGQMLLCKHTYRRAEVWGLPGGHLEFGEQPDEAVRRELFEETGFGVREARLLLVESSHEIRKVILTYLCSGISGVFVPNEEVSQVQYFDPAALPPLRSEEQSTIEKALAALEQSDMSKRFDTSNPSKPSGSADRFVTNGDRERPDGHA